MNAPIERHERRRRVAVATALTAALACGIAAPASAAPADPIAPVPDAWGRHYVDAWSTNTSANTTPESNAAIGLLSTMLKYWTPEANPTPEFDADGKFVPGSVGEIEDDVVLDANIAESARITEERTAQQAAEAYLIDRRNQNYSAIDGLGPYAAAFRAGTNAGTTIPDEIPADATAVKYDDKGNSAGAWADTDSTYGAMVELVQKFRDNSASTNPSKEFYDYARPFRWSDDVKVLPTLEPVKKKDSEWASDGGYPSGHTNAGWLATYALAYSAPERFQQLLTNGSEIGNSRIVAGMHSPADVIGGRMMSTAVAAAALNDPANAELMARARAAAEALIASEPDAADTVADTAGDEALYDARLTYGLPRVGDTTLPVVVPKGAEVLLETRQPYLTAEQRRWVLQSTGLGSGYALLDDAEGWGRMNLYAAADGYSAFDTDVTVDMDAADGGFSAADTWRNDIDGAGSLTKTGSGSLTLSGENTYTGDTRVEDGSLIAASATGFGAGSLTVAGGIAAETSSTPVIVSGDLTVASGAEMRVSVDSAQPALRVGGDVEFDGSLRVAVADGYLPADDVVIATYAGAAPTIDRDAVEFTGLPDGYTPTLVARDGAVHLVNAAAALEPVIAGQPSIAGAPVLGERLVLDPGTWQPAPVQLSYQWFRGTEPIDGATALSYTPVEADLGQRVSVSVTGTKEGFASQTRRATASGAVTAPITASPDADPTPSASATPAPASGALAATGSEVPALLPIVALGALALGGLVVATRMRAARSRRS